MYEDMHEVNPCPNCGHKVSRFGSGRFTELNGEKQWVNKNGEIILKTDS